MLLAISSTASVAQAQLIAFTSELSDHLKQPSNARYSEAVRINPIVIRNSAPGELLLVQIGDGEYAEIIIDEIVGFVNGDFGVSARGRGEHFDLSFTLTVGETSLFGYIATAESLWQITADGNGDEFLGWVYEPMPLSSANGVLANDYIIPNRNMPLSRGSAINNNDSYSLPLQLAQNEAVDAVRPATSEGITSDNFSVSQEFTPSPVVAGSTTAAQVTLTNTSGEVHSNLQLEIFFLLEDADLVSADSTCSETVSASLQKVLLCGLGSFQPGEEKILNFTVQSSSNGVSRIFSTAVIGNLRDDVVVNVIEDVRKDSDFDGISDFNEALVGTDSNDPSSVDFSVSVIDVLALYSSGAESIYPLGVQTRINQLISVANQIYRDSGVAISLRPVHHQQVDYSDSYDMDTALDHLIQQSNPAFSNLDGLRQAYGADLVALFRPLEGDASRCGLAPVGGFQTNGYLNPAVEQQLAVSTIAIDCPLDIAVAHELGHNMGLTHSHAEDGYGGTFNFATGHGVDGQFVTVMAYPGAFNNAARVSRFSNPAADCLGFACGVNADEEFGADAVQALNIVRHQIASYQPTVVPDLPKTSVTSLSGNTNAVISIAASRDSGLSFDSQFSPEDKVDLSVVVRVDDRHIGSEGSLHVLVGEQGERQLYQLDENGRLTAWNGNLDGLVPLNRVQKLNGEERLSLLNGFQFNESLVGLDLVVYVGYRVFSSGDFVYTDTPLSLQIIQSN